MADVLLTCPCGYEMRLSEYAVGMTTTCPNCGAVLTVSEENVEPIDEARPVVLPEDNTEYEAVREPSLHGDRCSRCGKKFRGEWDQYRASSGLVCHVCANLAGGLAPELDEAAPLAPGPSVTPLASLAPPRGPEPERPFVERHERVIKRLVLVAGLAVIAFALFYPLFAPYIESKPADVEDARAPAAELPYAATVLVYALTLTFRFGAEFAALYLILAWSKKLPDETFGKNVLAVGIVALGLWALGLWPMFVPVCIVSLTAGVLRLWIVWSVYDLGIGELVFYMVARGLVGLVAGLVHQFIGGVIGLIVT
ncbi:MAG TPA: hypothetical protein HPP77_10500 [Candidatus Hydrogenedentes bacterium]|nr:hypothetical protein [Candidatus Hydrogenedentota bacterium]HIJ73765.1 hypothetical protein [Candidatus Hydrogenedentota bacterium]